MLPAVAALELDPIRLQASLSGEVLLREDGARNLLFLLGCRDPGFAQEVVDSLATALRKQAAEQGLPVKLVEEKEGQAKRYRLDLEVPGGSCP